MNSCASAESLNAILKNFSRNLGEIKEIIAMHFCQLMSRNMLTVIVVRHVMTCDQATRNNYNVFSRGHGFHCRDNLQLGRAHLPSVTV